MRGGRRPASLRLLETFCVGLASVGWLAGFPWHRYFLTIEEGCFTARFSARMLLFPVKWIARAWLPIWTSLSEDEWGSGERSESLFFFFFCFGMRISFVDSSLRLRRRMGAADRIIWPCGIVIRWDRNTRTRQAVSNLISSSGVLKTIDWKTLGDICSL